MAHIPPVDPPRSDNLDPMWYTLPRFDDLDVVWHIPPCRSAADRRGLDPVSDLDPSFLSHFFEITLPHAEDIDQQMAILPEIVTPTLDITINDIQVGNPDVPLSDDQDRLRQ